jgi:chemotaxis protein CheX
METESNKLSFDVPEFMNRHVASVFETMLSMKATPVTDGSPFAQKEQIIGSVGVGGERVTGAVYLHLPADFSRLATTSMLGMALEDVPADNDVNDVVGELTNMLAGGLKSALCDAGAECAVSTPAIIRGKGIEIEATPDVAREFLVVECGKHRITVETHIKFN